MSDELLIQMFEKFEKRIRTLAEQNNEVATIIIKRWRTLNSESEKLKFIQIVEHFSIMMTSGQSHGEHLPTEFKS